MAQDPYKQNRRLPKFNRQSSDEGDNAPRKEPKFSIYWVYLIIFAVLMVFQFSNFGTSAAKTDINNFKRMVAQGDVQKFQIVSNSNTVRVFLKDSSIPKYATNGPNSKLYTGKLGDEAPQLGFTITTPEDFNKEIQAFYADNHIPLDQQPIKEVVKDRDIFTPFINVLLPFLIFIGLWILLMRKMGGGAGSGGGPGGIFNIGKSKATLFDKGTRVNINFGDVAGLDEAKVEVMEIVDFLKSPKKYTSLGGKIPKGALLIGPPGTGKTLLAKAMAGEAQVPFFSLSGSDFVEMFVGVGASRVRDLFKQAREKAPCIIFIDEIDAIGRARGKNMMMSNDERESTLNQLLVEMDGFSGESGIIVLAATNRPDVLDTALLRPGRFDRQITIDKPDVKGREAIFKVHLKPIKVSEKVDIHKMAEQTPGFAGAMFVTKRL